MAAGNWWKLAASSRRPWHPCISECAVRGIGGPRSEAVDRRCFPILYIIVLIHFINFRNSISFNNFFLFKTALSPTCLQRFVYLRSSSTRSTESAKKGTAKEHDRKATETKSDGEVEHGREADQQLKTNKHIRRS